MLAFSLKVLRSPPPVLRLQVPAPRGGDAVERPLLGSREELVVCPRRLVNAVEAGAADRGDGDGKAVGFLLEGGRGRRVEVAPGRGRGLLRPAKLDRELDDDVKERVVDPELESLFEPRTPPSPSAASLALLLRNCGWASHDLLREDFSGAQSHVAQRQGREVPPPFGLYLSDSSRRLQRPKSGNFDFTKV